MYSLVVNFDKEESSKWERTKIEVTMRTNIKYNTECVSRKTDRAKKCMNIVVRVKSCHSMICVHMLDSSVGQQEGVPNPPLAVRHKHPQIVHVH